MSGEIIEGTPLEGYLKDTQTIEDWGIDGGFGSDPEEGLEEVDGQFTPSEPERARPNTVIGPNRQQVPLLLGNGRVYTEEERFRQSLRSILGQKVSFEETIRFLDQFHYIIVSSGLLESQPLYNTWSVPSDIRRRKLLFDQKKPWTRLYVEPVFSATGGGGIVSLCVLLHYKYRLSATKEERALVAVIISLAVIIYYFATSRRRLLRSLRHKALSFIEMFCHTAKAFDSDCIRALRELHEVDVVANGFAAQARSNFLMKNRISGRKLRSILGSSLQILNEAYVDAIRDTLCMSDKSSIEQFLNIYELKNQMEELKFVLSDDFVGFSEKSRLLFEDSQDGVASVKDLKLQLRQVAFSRRLFLCCLLAAPSSGRTTATELETWTTISDHLLNASNLSEQLSNLIINERFNPSNEFHEETKKQAENPVCQSSSFIDAYSRVKHLGAQLSVLREGCIPESETQDYIDAINEEIAAFTSQWKKFTENRAVFSPADKSGIILARTHSKQSDSLISEDSASSPTLVVSPEVSEFSAFSIPELVEGMMDDSSINTTINSSVLEGEASAFTLPKSSLSREERISIAKRDRVSPKDSSALMSRKSSLILELSNALQRRQ